jgi:hypothetical protein
MVFGGHAERDFERFTRRPRTAREETRYVSTTVVLGHSSAARAEVKRPERASRAILRILMASSSQILSGLEVGVGVGHRGGEGFQRLREDGQRGAPGAGMSGRAAFAVSSGQTPL